MSARQDLPADIAETLRSLRGAAFDAPAGPERDLAWRRLVGYGTLLEDAGWGPRAIDRALGLSRNNTYELRQRYEPLLDAGWSVPAPPQREGQPNKPSRVSPPLDEPTRAALHELRLASEGVRGFGRPDDPAWRAGREFAHSVHALTERGYSLYRIASDLGVTHPALIARLARHGLREWPPSQAPKSGGRELVVVR